MSRWKQSAHTAHNPHGRVEATRTDGPGVTFRCNRCGAVTITAGKRGGALCRLTRGCKGHLLRVGDDAA
jgi:hypothetical protein